MLCRVGRAHTKILFHNLTNNFVNLCPAKQLLRKLSMAFIYAGRCTSENRLEGKTAIITGCNTGIGKINALDFYKRGCRVIMACRDTVKAEKTAEDIKNQCPDGKGTLVIKKLDLASLASVRKCAQEILDHEEHVQLLINNAGVMLCPKTETEDGFELQMGTNHFGHFLFTLLLLPLLKKSTPVRIINVSSVAHRHGTNNFEDIHWKTRQYKSMTAYGESKLANIHFTTELARRLDPKWGINVYAVHPGWVRTELGRHINSTFFPGFRQVLTYTIGPFMKSPEQGAQTQIYCAIDDKPANETGLYYVDCKPARTFNNALNKEAAKKLFELSADIVGYDLKQF